MASTFVSSWFWPPNSNDNPSSSSTLPPFAASTTAKSKSNINDKNREDANDQDASPEDALNDLLEQFKSSAVPLTSRFRGAIEPQRQGKGPSVFDLWRHAWFVATKAKDIATSLALHHLRGPTRPSWNIEMTLLAAFMRNLASNTHLIDVPTLRLAMSLGGLIPTPSDALVTPVTWKVRRRGLRGFLKAEDEKEWDGRGTSARGARGREMSGEWVVGKRTWMRLQREWKGLQQQQHQGSKDANTKTNSKGHQSHSHPHGSRHHSHHNNAKVKERVVLYIHGGAYYTASPSTHRLITINLSKHLDARVFAIDYRLAPDTRFPGPVHDAAEGYFRLVDDLGIPPGNIIIAGDSAGAGLSIALMMYLRDEGYRLPGGAILMCPWVDLTMSCASWDTNAAFDIITFPVDPADHMNPVACYLGPEGMTKYITHPYASPLFGDFSNLPPMLIQSGDCEVLRDEVTLLAHKATLAGVDVVHEVYEDAVHVFQLYPFLEQSRKAFRSCRRFVLETLPEVKARRRMEAKEKEKVRAERGSGPSLQRYASNLSYVSTESRDTTTTDVPVVGPVSPPPTPPRRVSDLPSVSPSISALPSPASRLGTVPLFEPSLSMSSHKTEASETGSNSDSEDSGSYLDAMVESVLEREIKGSGVDDGAEPDIGGGGASIGRGVRAGRSRSGSMFVVDGHGVEQPKERVEDVGKEEELEDDAEHEHDSGDEGDAPAQAQTNERPDLTPILASAPSSIFSLPWSFKSSKSSSHIPTVRVPLASPLPLPIQDMKPDANTNVPPPRAPTSAMSQPSSPSLLRHRQLAPLTPAQPLSSSREASRGNSASTSANPRRSSSTTSLPARTTAGSGSSRRSGMSNSVTFRPVVDRLPPLPQGRTPSSSSGGGQAQGQSMFSSFTSLSSPMSAPNYSSVGSVDSSTRTASSSAVPNPSSAFTNISSREGMSSSNLSASVPDMMGADLSADSSSSMSSSSFLTPPAIGNTNKSRANLGERNHRRERTTSHPDMLKLMAQYAQTGPANKTTTFVSRSRSGSGAEVGK